MRNGFFRAFTGPIPQPAAATVRIAVVSDIHHASAAEQARGHDFELRAIPGRWRRAAVRLYRDHLWLRQPMTHNHLLDRFLERARDCDFAVANGDYSCNSGFVGAADDAAADSVREVLGQLRQTFGERFRAHAGDHELGKLSFVGGRGGMRLASWRRATGELGLSSFWRVALGNWVLLGITSSLVALPVYAHDLLPEERAEWERLRAEHLAEIRGAFDSLQPEQGVILFTHDPSALSFLWREDAVRRHIHQVRQTLVGHLHTPLVFRLTRLLAGVPVVRWLGHSPFRWTSALREARQWRPFQPRLCPSLAGCELLKDGGFYIIELDPGDAESARCVFHPLPR